MVKINKDENNKTNSNNSNEDDDNVVAIRRRRPPYIISYSVLTVLCFCIGSLFSSYNGTTNNATINLYYLNNGNNDYDVKVESSSSSSSSNSIINTTTAAAATVNHKISSASASLPTHNDGGSNNNEDIISSSQLPVATNASLSSSSLQLLLSVDSDSEEDSELDLIEYISPDPNKDIDPLSLYVDLDKALRNEDDPRRYVRVLKKPLDPTSSLSKLKNTPIFVMTLPKGGTTTIHNYFQCGYGLQNNTYSIHHLYPSIRNNKRIANRIGTTMKNNLDQNKPILSPIINSKNRKTNNTTNSIRDDENNLSQYSVFSDFGSFDFVKKNNRNNNNKRNKESSPRTTLLQTDILDNIIRYYPNSTLLYIRRSPDDWYNSAKNWDGGQLLQKLRLFKSSKLTNSFFPSNIDRYSKFSSSVSSDDDNDNGHSDSYPYYNNSPEQDKYIFTTFYRNYESYLRKFVTDHNNNNAQNNNGQNLTYIELPLNNETGIEMEKLTGISSKLCWSKSNIGHYIAT